MNARDLIKIECQFHYCLYPKPASLLGVDDEHKYGITKWEVIRNLTNTLPQVIDPIGNELATDKEGLITIVGNFVETPKKDNTYTILASRVHNDKYGEQYEIIYMNTIVDLSSVSNVNKFLTQIAHPRQVKALYDTLADPIKAIADHDIKALTSVKGIGPYLANKLIERYDANKDDSNLYIELSEYNLTPSMINKLKSAYGTPNKIISVIKDNPYQLSFDVEGVGFKMADRIALEGGMDPKSNKRVAAYIYYMLMDNANDKGNSYLTATEIINGLFDFFGGKSFIYKETLNDEGEVVSNNIKEAMDSLVDNGKVCIEDNPNKGRRRVFLRKIYELESNIANELTRLRDAKNSFKYDDWEDRVKEVEEKQGFEFTQEQKDGIKLGLDSQVCLIHGLAGCVDGDTEFFDGTGWKKISGYKEGDKVLQWVKSDDPNNREWANGKAELVFPNEYIKLPCDKLYHFETKYGLSQTISDEHRIVCITPDNVFCEYHINDMYDKEAGKIKDGWNRKFITTFNYRSGEEGIQLSDDEIRLTVAFIADGSIQNVNTKHCRFHIKKDRKKDRLRNLFSKCGINYNEKVSAAPGYTDFHFYLSEIMCTKAFTQEWYMCNNHQLQVICDELIYWDGNVSTSTKGATRRKIDTTIKENADFIQFAYSATGRRASILIKDRRGRIRIVNGKEYITKSIDYTVCLTDRVFPTLCSDVRLSHSKTDIVEVTPKDGFKYCFSVPSTYLILRKDNRIFVTGNCGKSTLVSGILGSLSSYSFTSCALSGKSSARIQEVTGEKANTIHKLLGYNPMTGGFEHNETNKLPYDIIILDEISMVGGEIFLDLIKSIKTGAKLIMLGDTSQLPCIGTLNIAKDMLNSPRIPTVNLTQVHRQAAKSGILSTSYEVRANRPVFADDTEGIIPFGEDRDMIFDLSYDSCDTLSRAMAWFKKGFSSKFVDEDINKIQLIAPIKERGGCSVYDLNEEAQSYILSKRGIDKTHDDHITVGIGTKTHNIYKTDKVMCIKNDYNARVYDSYADDRVTAIFNGWVGTVVDINPYEGSIIVHFPLGNPDEQDVILDTVQARNCLTLGYASTVHKLQGSDCPMVIGALDYSTPPNMLTCQLLYTLLTRAKKRCILVGQTGAINRAVLTDNVCIKKTFLPEILEGKKIILEGEERDK